MTEKIRFLDPTTEAFYGAWVRTEQQAAREMLTELEEILSQVPLDLKDSDIRPLLDNDQHAISLPGLDPASAFNWFTRLLIEVERAIERRACRHTTEIWLLQCRRALACQLLTGDTGDLLNDGARANIQARLACAIGRFAAPGNTVLPDRPGAYESPVTERLVVDVYVLMGLCRWYEKWLADRGRILDGGMLTFDPLPFPTVRLPPHVESRRKFLRDRSNGLGVLSRAGFFIPVKKSTQRHTEEETRRLLWNSGWRRNFHESPHETASDVRFFGLEPFAPRLFLQALEVFGPAIQQHWGMSPIEIVSAFVISCLTFLGEFSDSKSDSNSDPDSGNRLIYIVETRSILSIEESSLVATLSRNLPSATRNLGGTIPDDKIPEVVQRFLDRFVTRPGEPLAQGLPGSGALRLNVPVPCLFRAGDKVLIDLSMILFSLSSVVNSLDWRSFQLKDKGRHFEDQVRMALTSACEGIEVVPEMERRLFDENGREVGEADVVVRCGDTAFLIECKSHRLRGDESLSSYEQVVQRTRNVAEWARQARRTAEFLATCPKGPKHRVPEEIHWIVPILCSPIPEDVLDFDDETVYLVRDELLIAMTPAELLGFIRSRRWEKRSEVSQLPVRHPDTLRAWGRALAEGGRFEEAIEVLSEALRREPNSLGDLFQLAEYQFGGGRPAAAVENYHKALEISPGHPLILLRLGVACFYLGRYDDAIVAYRQILEGEPRNRDALLFLANALDCRGDVDEAIRIYRKVLRLAPQDARAYYNLAIALSNRGRWAQAIRAYRKAVELEPNHFEAHFNLGACLLRLGSPGGALEHLGQAVVLRPSLDLPRLKLAAALEKVGRLEDAFVCRAEVHAANEEMEEALTLARKALEIRPGHAKALFLLGQVLLVTGRHEEAVSPLFRVAELEPHDFNVQHALGRALLQLGRLREAQATFRKARLALPDDPEVRESFVASLTELGAALNAAGHTREGISLFEEALEILPRSPMTLFNLGYALHGIGELERAADTYRKMMEIQPDSPKAMSNLGALLLQAGRIDEALDACVKALARDPDDWLALFSLSRILLSQGWFDAASQHILRLLALLETGTTVPKDPEILNALEQRADYLREVARKAEAEEMKQRIVAIRLRWTEESSPHGRG